MPFPLHDKNWTEITDYLKPHLRSGERILAPDDFVWAYDRIFRYANTHLQPAERYDWAILHKGQLDRIAPAFLRDVPQGMTPVLANPVFVLWTARPELPALDRGSEHFRSYFSQVLARARSAGAPPAPAEEPVLPDPGMLVRFASLGEGEFREAMNRFWRHGGYRYDTLRDQEYYAEIDRYLADFVGDGAGQRILDLCCGTGRLRDIVTASKAVQGVDVSDTAIEMARERHRDCPAFQFDVMDAHRLDYPDASYDTVLFVDSIEHVLDIERVMAEIARVTRPGGKLFLTVANSDGLNQIMSRKLGLGDFVTNYQHIREFSHPETLAMLSRHGFAPLRSGGIFLFPYWGVPGLDEAVRPLTDNDPEVVELFRVLGRRCGPEYAYAFVILAGKVVDPQERSGS